MGNNVSQIITPLVRAAGSLADDILKSSKRDCPFLHRLPIEIRLMIYRYLLVGRNVRREINMKSWEYDNYRESILKGSDYSYCFHPSILGASQRIRTEALDLFRRENTFVSIIHEYNQKSCWEELRYDGVAVFAKNDQARTFPAVGMTVKFGDCSPNKIYDDESRDERETIVFLLEDLPAACVTLQRKVNSYGRYSKDVDIRVSLSRHIGEISSASQTGFPLPGSKLWECLDPLRNIRGANFVSIDGLISVSHTTTIVAKMREEPPDTRTFMAMIEAQVDQCDQALLKGVQKSTIDLIKATLNTVRACSLGEDEKHEPVLYGRFKDIQAGQILANTVVLLHCVLAEAYLQHGHSRLARIYVERIYRPLATWDNRFNIERFPLRIPEDGAIRSVYAELLLVAAKISLTHGHHYNALVELSEASDLDDSNEEINALLKQTQKRYWLRVRRRESIYNREVESAERKFDAILQVVRNRMSKGDEALAKCKFELAEKQYITAFSRTTDIEDVPNDLMLDLYSKLTTVALELHEYDHVKHWADCIMAFKADFMNIRWEPRRKESLEYAKEAFYTAYFSKAVAYQKEGNIRAAIRAFENAFLCDSGCAATYYQLETLKRRCLEAHQKAVLPGSERTENVARQTSIFTTL